MSTKTTGRRRGDYFPDTMSRKARELLDDISGLRTLHRATHLRSIDVQVMRGVMRNACARQAGEIIGAGCGRA